MKNLIRIGLIYVCLLAQPVSAQNGSWKLEKNENGIKVYTRTVEGEDIREFKATTTIDAARSKIAEIIVNVGDYKNWYPDISEAKIIKQLSSNEFYVYNVIDLPWPATDRDGVTKMTITHDQTSTTIAIKAVSGIKPKVDDRVRITKSYGYWKLTTEGTKTLVHFQYFASPAGSLPDWMINMFIVDNPYETFVLLKRKSTLAQ